MAGVGHGNKADVRDNEVANAEMAEEVAVSGLQHMMVLLVSPTAAFKRL